jgi:hypothetical protein
MAQAGKESLAEAARDAAATIPGPGFALDFDGTQRFPTKGAPRAQR